jgi:hypothetical protein
MLGSGCFIVAFRRESADPEPPEEGKEGVDRGMKSTVEAGATTLVCDEVSVGADGGGARRMLGMERLS